MELIDLSRTLEVVDREKFPPLLMPLYRIISPEVEYIDHAGGARIMGEFFGVSANDLPDGEGWAEENISMSTHLGTHVDAPWHYGSTCAGRKARTVDEIPLSDLFLDGIVLDMTHKKGTAEAITVSDLESALAGCGCAIKPGDAVLVRTDHDKFAHTDPAKYMYPGMVRESALWLAESGARVVGTDALGFDRPFPVMLQDFKRTGDRRFIWDAHYAYREAEVFVVQQLANLEKLPRSGFKVAFFPLKIARASAAPARVVAFVGGHFDK